MFLLSKSCFVSRKGRGERIAGPSKVREFNQNRERNQEILRLKTSFFTFTNVQSTICTMVSSVKVLIVLSLGNLWRNDRGKVRELSATFSLTTLGLVEVAYYS